MLRPEYASYPGCKGASRGRVGRVGGGGVRSGPIGGKHMKVWTKPAVREQAMVAINEGGLDRLLDILQ